MIKQRRIQLRMGGLLLCFATMLSAQVAVDSTLTGRRISRFILHGNDKTHADVILREMKVKAGESLDWNRLQEDQQRIFNLYLFNRVLIMAEADGPDALVRVAVTERFYFFPIPILFLNDRDWSKLSYGLGAAHMNIRGRAETLNAIFWLGHNPSVRASYINPWIGGAAHLFARFTGYSDRIESKAFGSQVTERHQGLMATVGKRFGYHTKLSITVGFKSISMKPAQPGQTLSPDGRDDTFYTGISLLWDRRDVAAYPHSGWWLSASAFQHGFDDNVNYHQLRAEGRAFLPVTSKSTLALRLAGVFTNGDVPVYDRIYLGYTERIRGHFSRIIQGENRLVAGAAFRFPLIPIRYITLGNMPQLSNLPLGLSWSFFVDAGWIWPQGAAPMWRGRVTGFGGGLHVHLPYINVFRLEAAWNEQGASEIIADLFIDI